jgi:hypothetical protein
MCLAIVIARYGFVLAELYYLQLIRLLLKKSFEISWRIAYRPTKMNFV